MCALLKVYETIEVSVFFIFANNLALLDTKVWSAFYRRALMELLIIDTAEIFNHHIWKVERS